MSKATVYERTPQRASHFLPVWLDEGNTCTSTSKIMSAVPDLHVRAIYTVKVKPLFRSCMCSVASQSLFPTTLQPTIDLSSSSLSCAVVT